MLLRSDVAMIVATEGFMLMGLPVDSDFHMLL